MNDPVDRTPRWKVTTAILVAVLIGIAISYHVYSGHWPWSNTTTERAQESIIIPVHLPPAIPVAPDATDIAGKDCLKQQQALLATARGETIAKIHAIVSDRLKHHRISSADASAILSDVAAHPDGEGRTAGTLEGLVEWNLTLPSGRIFHFADTRHVCICHQWQFTLTPLLVPHAERVLPVRRVVAMPSGCIEVHGKIPAGNNRSVRFTTIRREPIGNFNCWGFVDNAQRTGSPNNCDWCVWTQDAVREMENRYRGTFQFFHTSIAHVSKDVRDGENEATDFTIVLPPEAAAEGIAVCIEVDGKIYEAALITPSEWTGRRAVSIPADYWTNPRYIRR